MGSVRVGEPGVGNRAVVRLGEIARTRHRPIVSVLILAVIVLGVLYSYRLGSRLRYWDEQRYYKLATHIVRDHSYTMDGTYPEAYRPPGYPIFLSVFKLLGMGIVWLRVMNFVVLGACVYLIYMVVKSLSGPVAGVIAALLVALYPLLFYTAGTLMPQILASLLLLVVLHLLTRSVISKGTTVIAGLALGFLMLTVPTFVYVIPVLGVWWCRFGRLPNVKRHVIAIVIACLVTGAWSVRNYVHYRSWLFVSANAGYNMLLGNSENSTPDSGADTDVSRYVRAAARLQMNQVEQDRYFRSQALAWVWKHKMAAAKLYALKVLNHFNYRNRLATKRESSPARDAIMLLTYGPLLLLFLLRLALWNRATPSRFEILLIALYLLSAFVMAVFFTRVRYRVPLDFLLIAVVAVFIGRFIPERSDTKR